MRLALPLVIALVTLATADHGQDGAYSQIVARYYTRFNPDLHSWHPEAIEEKHATVLAQIERLQDLSADHVLHFKKFIRGTSLREEVTNIAAAMDRANTDEDVLRALGSALVLRRNVLDALLPPWTEENEDSPSFPARNIEASTLLHRLVNKLAEEFPSVADIVRPSPNLKF